MSNSEYDFDYVNFTDNNVKKSTINEKPADFDDFDDFDETTTELYRTMRLYKIDPITNEEIPKDLIFEFKYKWNPITGQRKDIDEMGSLCFNAWNLYQYYYQIGYLLKHNSFLVF